MRFVSIDTSSMIETRKGYKYYTFYRMMDRRHRLCPHAIYKLKEIEWRLPYKHLAYLASLIAMMSVIIIK